MTGLVYESYFSWLCLFFRSSTTASMRRRVSIKKGSKYLGTWELFSRRTGEFIWYALDGRIDGLWRRMTREKVLISVEIHIEMKWSAVVEIKLSLSCSLRCIDDDGYKRKNFLSFGDLWHFSSAVQDFKWKKWIECEIVISRLDIGGLLLRIRLLKIREIISLTRSMRDTPIFTFHYSRFRRW